MLELVLDGKIDHDPLVINDRHQERLLRNKEAASAEQPADSPPMCQALTKKGAPCRNRTLWGGSDYCKVHQHYQNSEPGNPDKTDAAKDIKAQIAESLSEVV